jgi:hypothetical protein
VGWSCTDSCSVCSEELMLHRLQVARMLLDLEEESFHLGLLVVPSVMWWIKLDQLLHLNILPCCTDLLSVQS